jgi:5S rRNA maturation endonuclease (ribonuclease M5)
MNRIEDLIVVEGKTDIDFLSSFIDADFYSVNGSAVNEKDIDFLKNISSKEE